MATVEAKESAPAASNPKRQRQPRPPKPNYNLIHQYPLPIRIYPLPTLIPHNPLSLLQFTVTYLSQLFFRPQSHPSEPYKAYFSVETHSIHVTDPATIRTLWEMGFFGKGTLSRSEPTWLDREKKRRGILAADTSEEATRKRREERRQFKLERAKKEREAIEDMLRAEREGKSLPNGNSEVVEAMNGHANGVMEELSTSIDGEVISTVIADDDSLPSQGPTKTVRFATEVNDKAIPPVATTPGLDDIETEEVVVGDMEHLQLTCQEALFLSYGLGVLQVYEEDSRRLISSSELLGLSCKLPTCLPAELNPDDSFLLSYVVYHHFRSLGWVVRSGIKFAVDYLLYNRGPVFSHAEFAVMILPSYSDPYWSATEERRKETQRREARSWWWLHCVNRVQSQVRKSLVLAYVNVPAPETDLVQTADIGRMLKRYKVREIALKRWIPNRSRD